MPFLSPAKLLHGGLQYYGPALRPVAFPTQSLAGDHRIRVVELTTKQIAANVDLNLVRKVKQDSSSIDYQIVSRGAISQGRSCKCSFTPDSKGSVLSTTFGGT